MRKQMHRNYLGRAATEHNTYINIVTLPTHMVTSQSNKTIACKLRGTIQYEQCIFKQFFFFKFILNILLLIHFLIIHFICLLYRLIIIVYFNFFSIPLISLSLFLSFKTIININFVANMYRIQYNYICRTQFDELK